MSFKNILGKKEKSLNKEVESLSKEVKDVKKHQIEIPELGNAICKIKLPTQE